MIRTRHFALAAVLWAGAAVLWAGAAVLWAGAAGAAWPPPPPTLQQTISDFIAALNGTSAEAFARLFAQQASLTDTLGVFNWQGQQAPTRYFAALQADLKKSGWSDLRLSPNGADNVLANSANAYAAVPLFINYAVHGARHQDRGIFTLTFAQYAGGWKITSATWTYVTPPPG